MQNLVTRVYRKNFYTVKKRGGKKTQRQQMGYHNPQRKLIDVIRKTNMENKMSQELWKKGLNIEKIHILKWKLFSGYKKNEEFPYISLSKLSAFK